MQIIKPIVFLLLEIAVFYKGAVLLFQECKKPYFWGFIGAGILLIGNLFFTIPDMDIIPVLIRCYVFLFLICSLPGGMVYDRITRFAIMFLMIGCLEGMLGGILKGFSVDTNSYEGCLLESGLAFLCLLLLGCFGKGLSGKKEQKVVRTLKKWLLPIAILVATGGSASVALLLYSVDYVPKVGIKELAVVLDFVANLGIGVLGMLFFYIWKSNEKMEAMLDMEQHMRKMQMEYYEQILEREKSTRKYRHDMSNHLLCLNEYAKKGDLSTLVQYLQTLQTEMKDIQGKTYQTGNLVLDVLSNYYASTLPEHVEVQVEGTLCIHTEEKMLCTIFGNLLRNAAEEVCHGGECAYLRVKMEQGEKYARITIENSKVKEALEKKNTYKKEEAAVHYGFGLQNVKETVDALAGSLVISESAEEYRAEVILPCKN